jgi:AcrR family transcriptional regulator
MTEHTSSTAGGGVPEPPWWNSPSRSASRTQLSREAILDAALRVLDREGLDGLSMRKVADEVDAGVASLYWHVANKEQLLVLVLDRVIGEIELPDPDPDRWQEQLREVAWEGRAAFLRYRDVARASMGRVPIGPNLVRFVEWMLQLTRGAGIPLQPAAWFGDLFALYIASHALEDDIGRTTDDHGSHGDDDAAPDSQAAIGAYLAALPADQFPQLTEAGAALAAGDSDERFAFGLDLLLRGLASHTD